MQNKPLMKAMEAHEYIGGPGVIGRNRWYELLRSGAIPSVRVGNRFYVAKAALDRVLEEIARGEWVDKK